jgi:hypothetical protein
MKDKLEKRNFVPLSGGPQWITIMKDKLEKRILSPSQGDRSGSQL